MPQTKHKLSTLSLLIACASSTMSTSVALADAANTSEYAMLQDGVPYLFVVHKGRSVKVARTIDKSYRLPSGVYNTMINQDQNCPPFCLNPLNPEELPVATVSEYEIIDFMTSHLRNNTGVLIDTRSAVESAAQTIPGSINYFARTIVKGTGDKEFDDMFSALGVKPRGEVSWLTSQMENLGLSDSSEVTDTLDFTNAKELVIYGTSQTDISTVHAIQALLKAGYPAHKLRWYHGGIASWAFWGFTTYAEPKVY